MGYWEQRMGWDTGSNNSDDSIGPPPWFDEMYEDFKDDLVGSDLVTSQWEPVEQGIPTQCYCGGGVLLKTHTNGLQNGRRYYSCESNLDDGECHVYKLWEDAITEEIADTNSKLKALETRVSEWIKEVDCATSNNSSDLKALETRVSEWIKEMKPMRLIGVLLCVIAVIHCYCLLLVFIV